MGGTTVAERVATVLVELGVERVYGLPGEDHMTLLDAFAGAGIRYRAAYNESSAVLMAATDTRLTGRPGVALLSLAPGVSNGMNGLVHAYLDGLPVLVLSGQHGATRLPFVVRQGFDVEQMVRPATKWTSRLPAGIDPAQLLCKAVDLTVTGPQGPVYVEVPDDVLTRELPDRAGQPALDLLAAELRDGGSNARGTLVPSAETLADLARRLTEARRPAVVVGGRHAGVASDTLARFADAVRCPVFVTSAQKGLLDSHHPYFAGTFLGGNVEARILGEADLIMTVDLEGYDVYNKPWPYDAATVSVTGAPLTEWRIPFAVRVTADPETCLRELGRRVIESSSQWRPEDVATYRDDLRRDLLAPVEGGLSVAAAVDAALGACDEDTVVAADAGFSKPLVALLSDTARPGNFLSSNGLSTMGFTVPAAIAAAYATGRRVVGFLGDGSLLMRLSELAIARDLDVPPVFVAVMDRSLSQIEIKQARRSLTTVGVGLPDLSCADLGRSLGIRGADVDTADAIAPLMREAWAAGEALLIGVHVDAATSPPTFELLRG